MDLNRSDDESMGELVKRLAQETQELLTLELAKVRREATQQARRAIWIFLATYVLVVGVSSAALVFSVGGIFSLERLTGDYGTAAFLVGAILLGVAIGAFLYLKHTAFKMVDAVTGGKDDGRSDKTPAVFQAQRHVDVKG